MSGKYVIMIGSACIDEYFEADRWPGMGDKGLIRATGNVVGGMIANAACVLAGYGVDTRMFDALNSRQADFILKDLSSYGLNVDHVRIDDHLPDARCIIVRTKEDRAILVVSAEKEKIVLTKAELEFFSGASYIYTTPSELKNFDNPIGLMDQLRAKGVRFVMDIESSTFTQEDMSLLERTSVLFFNEFGFARCCGETSPEEFRAHLFESGVEVITVTLGADGSETYTADDSVRAHGHKVQVVDTTGAGDTFNSSFLYCLIGGHDIHTASAFANAAAADSVTRMGPKSGVGDAERIWSRLGKGEQATRKE